MHKTDIGEVDRHMITSEISKMSNHQMPDGYAMLMKPNKAETAARGFLYSGNVFCASHPCGVGYTTGMVQVYLLYVLFSLKYKSTRDFTRNYTCTLDQQS